jgi:hypothetical protein
MTAVALANLGLFMAYFGPLGVLVPDPGQAVAGAHRIVSFPGRAALALSSPRQSIP